jgi:chemotaxis protein MotC
VRPLIALAIFLISASTAVADDDTPKTLTGSEQADTRRLLNDLDALFLLQDATARGRRDAAELQKPLLRSIGEGIIESDLPEPDRIAPYVAAYVLSGGDPATAATLAKSEKLQPVHRLLLEGSSLFMQGDREEAAKRLGDIDVSRLPARVGGRVALAQALLERNAVAHQSGLSTAVALMPGTLVEESALRRSTLAFAESSEEKPFWTRLARYQRRFPDSLYARAFWEEIMSALATWRNKDRSPDLVRLDEIFEEMPVEQRRSLYLHLARQSSRVSNLVTAEFAARRALQLAAEGSEEQQAARLYLFLHAVASEKAATAADELKAIRRDLLDVQDQALLDAGLWIAEQITKPPFGGQSGPAGERNQENQLQSRAEDLLVDADRILTESRS